MVQRGVLYVVLSGVSQKIFILGMIILHLFG